MLPSGLYDIASNKRTQEDAVGSPAVHDEGRSDVPLAKKVKPTESLNPPCKTLHVRSLPEQVTEEELTSLVIRWARPVAILPLRTKSQAFIQMESLELAVAIYEYYRAHPEEATIRGKVCLFSYASKEDIQHKAEGPNHILLTVILNQTLPVTIEVIHEVFSRFGKVDKIVMFQKPGAPLQVFVQYNSLSSAVAARQALDGQNLYAGCCTLRVSFANVQELNVKYNNERSRDFNNPNLPSGPGEPARPAGAGSGLGSGLTTPPALLPFASPDLSALSLVNPLVAQQLAAASVLSGGANPPAVLNPFAPGVSGSGVPGSSIIVSNLDPDRVTPDHLFNLFSLYGDPLKVKILHNRRDSALIQMATPAQAELAISHLNGAPLFGRTLAVGQSKHATVQLPPRGTEMLDGRPLFQDYTDSKLLRFRGNPPSKIFANISPPTPVVHVANLPATATEEEIRQLFSQYGTVQDFRFFPTKTAKRQICSEDKRMALVQMRSTSEAVDALVCLHNYSFNGNNIRLSFSKSLPAMWNTPEGRALRDQMRAQEAALQSSLFAPSSPSGTGISANPLLSSMMNPALVQALALNPTLALNSAALMKLGQTGSTNPALFGLAAQNGLGLTAAAGSAGSPDVRSAPVSPTGGAGLVSSPTAGLANPALLGAAANPYAAQMAQLQMQAAQMQQLQAAQLQQMQATQQAGQGGQSGSGQGQLSPQQLQAYAVQQQAYLQAYGAQYAPYLPGYPSSQAGRT